MFHYIQNAKYARNLPQGRYRFLGKVWLRAPKADGEICGEKGGKC